jgi:hypothetical protein
MATDLFGAGLPVLTFVIGIVCLISSILGKPYELGPVKIPAPTVVLQRVTLGTLGVLFVLIPLWTLIFPNTTIGESILGLLPKPAPTAAASTQVADSSPDWSGNGESPLTQVGTERIAIWRVHDPEHKQSGIYVRNAGTRTIEVQLVGDCAQPNCKNAPPFEVAPIDRTSGPANDTRKPCNADAHTIFDTLEDFDFSWKIWFRENVSALSSC